MTDCRRTSALLAALTCLLAACWEDRGSCELWSRKLAEGQEATTAVRQLVDNRCVAARPLLLGHLGDVNLGSDILAALVALGRSGEAETAVRQALARGDTAVAAARQVVAWQLGAAEPELRAALADEGLALHHAQLLEAALALAPAARWVGTLADELGDDGVTMERSLAALAEVDWAAVAEPERAGAALALAELASRDNVAPERARTALYALGRVPPGAPLADGAALRTLETRAAAGNRAALLAAWCLDLPPAAATARALSERAGLAPAVRALAFAIGAGDPGARVATAPAEDDVAIALALAGGAAVVPALEARVAAEKGAARAAFARALALALPAERLASWEAELRASPSLLLRAIPDEPAIAAVLALVRRCGADAACHAGAVDESLPRLAALDAELAAARAALKEAEAKAQAAIAKDAARAQELAKASGTALAEAKKELEAIAARRDAIYAGVGEATRRVAELSALTLALSYAVRRLPAAAAPKAARAILASCHAEVCAELRAWAAVAAGERALACLLETPGAPAAAP